jgi:hypothetical protein
MRRRFMKATGLAVAGIMLLASAALADTAIVDGDLATNGVQGSVSLTAAPGASVSTSAGVRVNWQGSKHLEAGSSITLVDASQTNLPSGYSVGDASGTVPSGTLWNDNADAFQINSAVSFTAPSTEGDYNYTVKYDAGTFTCEAGTNPAGSCLNTVGASFKINLTVEESTPTNTAPTIAFTDAPATANEGDSKAYVFSIADAEAGDTHSFVSGYPDCGTGNVLGASSIDDSNNTGTFSCTFPDGLVPAVSSAVKVKVQDDGGLASNEISTSVLVSNVNPVVAAPSFSVTSIDCRTSVNLSGINFSDAGVNDANWSVDINWGDGTADTSYSTATQGSQSNQSHTYNAPGTYTATVSVTDKDTGQGSNTSSNSIEVRQVYAVDFLPPFDDSSPSGLIVNKMKNGRVVPVKATIYDVCAQAYVTDPSNVTIKISKTSGTNSTSDPVEEYADAGQSSSSTNAFRWTTDATAPAGGFWIYNLDSKALGLVVNNFYRVDVYVGAAKATVATWGVLQPVK